MKLSIEQHNALIRMARHFEKIEEMADRMGVEVDTMHEKFQTNSGHSGSSNSYPTMCIASRRKYLFMKETKSDAPFSRLSVIVNEDRF